MILDINKKVRNSNLIKKNQDFLWRMNSLYQRVKFGNELNKNASLKNLFHGQRCFLFGTGMSIDDIDLSRFKNQYTFGCNLLIRHKDFSKLNISFYSVCDSLYGLRYGVVEFSHPDNLLPKIDKSNKSKETIFFFHCSTKKFIKKNNLFLRRQVHFLVSRGIKPSGKIKTFDLDKPNDFMFGSRSFMIAASIYMGFKELYLFGMGYVYKPIQFCHFYDTQEEIEKAKKYKSFPVDKTNYDVRKVAEQNGVEIFNVVPDGFESPVYQKISLNDVYQIF